MKAHLRSTRIAPKKANLVAKMVRGKSVPDALASLERTNKKAARILEGVIQSAAANAKQNDNQNPDDLVIKTLTVNKAITYHRGIPMARGRMRRIRKFLSHITVTLGYLEEQKKEDPSTSSGQGKKEEKKAPAKKPSPRQSSGPSAKKKSQTGSQAKKSPVKSEKKQSKKPVGSTSSLQAGSKKSKTTGTSKSSSASKSSK